MWGGTERQGGQIPPDAAPSLPQLVPSGQDIPHNDVAIPGQGRSDGVVVGVVVVQGGSCGSPLASAPRALRTHSGPWGLMGAQDEHLGSPGRPGEP